MAISPTQYATAAEYRAVVGRTDTGQDTQIDTDLTAVSRLLDRRLGRFFGKDQADVARIYAPAEPSAYLWIDDLSTAPTSLKLDGDNDGAFETTLASSDYEMLPLNAALDPEARPYTRIGMTPWGNYGSFTAGVRVQVTGKFGWPTVPSLIKAATIQLCAIYRLETPRATRRIPELGEAIEASPDAQNIIKQLTDQYWRPRYL